MVTIRDQLVSSRSKTFDGVNACRFITVHETDNESVGADAGAHADLQTNGTVRNASWHVQVDGREAVRSFPDDVQCWHAGDGTGPGNTTSLAVEICVNADGDYDAAVRNAAEVVALWRVKHGVSADRVVQHGHWSGKNCPRRLRARGQWDRFVRMTEPGGLASMAGMTSPAKGRVSSEYGRRAAIPGVTSGTFHAGIDIANRKGTPIFAAFAGVVERTGWGKVRYRSGKGIVIRNPDGNRQYYGHLSRIRVRVGQHIRQGQRIADMGATGNVTGPHLHFEVWANRSPSSHRNPRVDFRHFGITPGSAPVGTSGASTSGGSSKRDPKAKGRYEWPWHRLRVDGKWGNISKRGYQRLLSPKSVGGYSGLIDADIAGMTVKAEQRWLNSRGYDAGPEDGVRGERTIKALQALLYDRGFYRRGRYSKRVMVDGKWQKRSVKGLQKLMNSQRKLYL